MHGGQSDLPPLAYLYLTSEVKLIIEVSDEWPAKHTKMTLGVKYSGNQENP